MAKAKAKDAFRTISEVAEWLDTPTHVLRFWESKFSQIKPVKGAGGRRYYRPTDMDLLGGIKQLLHEDGMTIKGTQKLLREKGAKHVATLGQSMTGAVAEPAKPAPKDAQKQVAAAPVDNAPVAEPTWTDVDDPTPTQVAATATPAEPTWTVVDDPAPVQDALPLDTPVMPSFSIDLPQPPEGLPDVPARLIGRAPVDTAVLRANAAQIAPLLARLDALHARMVG